MDLSGKVVAVTGASSGIGEAVALQAAAAGAAVSLAARRTDRIEALAQRITNEGGRALAVETDMGEEEQARAFVQRTHDELGRLDALVNNAGVMLLGPIEDADTEDWRRMVSVNVFGVLYGSHAAVPIMLEQGGGTIVNVSSVAGRVARAGSGVYNLTKFGVGAFSESLRQEVTGRGIRVVLVEPGAVDTELATHLSDAARENMQQRFGDMKMLEADDIAHAVLYAIGQPDHVSINEILVRPTQQEG